MTRPVGYAAWRRHVLAYYQSRRRTSHVKMRQVLDAAERLGVETTADLTTTFVARFVADRGERANANTTRGLVSYLRAATTLAVEEGWLERPPNWRRVTPAASPRRKCPALEGESVAALLDLLSRRAEAEGAWADHRLFALTSTIALTGLRFREAVGLRVEDLDLAGGWLEVRSNYRRLKTSASAQAVPLPDQAVKVLREWSPRSGPWLFPGAKRLGPWDGGAPGYRPIDRLREAASVVGVRDATWHGLRRTFATQAVRKWKMPVWAVQRILRHSSPATTELYLEVDGAPELRAMVAGVSYGSD